MVNMDMKKKQFHDTRYDTGTNTWRYLISELINVSPYNPIMFIII